MKRMGFANESNAHPSRAAGTELTGAAPSWRTCGRGLINAMHRCLLFAVLWLLLGFTLASAQEVHVVKDISPGTEDSDPDDLTPAGPFVYFTLAITEEEDSGELFRTDGTEAGTIQLTDLVPGGGRVATILGELGSELLFSASEGTVDNRELWKSDGTPEGTVLVRDINPSGESSPNRFAVIGDTAFFRADNGNDGAELWKTDGTFAGTVRVADINPGAGDSNPTELTPVGSNLFFSADDGTNGLEPWISDGTEGGTALLRNINPGSANGGFNDPAILGGMVIFRAIDSDHGSEPWITDGTMGGTQLLKNLTGDGTGSIPRAMTTLGDEVIFGAFGGITNDELWKTDGTEEGTVLIKDINPLGNSGLTPFTFFKDELYFAATDGTTGRELWKTDGTTTGTVRVKDINPTGDSDPNDFAVLGDFLYFAANDGVLGDEPWRTDGTEGGTLPVRDLYPGSTGSFPRGLTPFGGSLIFVAQPPETGSELWALETYADRLSNISTRGQVGTGDEVMIAGLIIEGGPRKVLVRVLGPTLDGFGVPNTLNDPSLQIFSGATLVGSNDNWRSAQETEIEATGLAPGDDAEPGIIVTLDEGPFTAIVSGVGGTTGNAIVEVFELD